MPELEDRTVDASILPPQARGWSYPPGVTVIRTATCGPDVAPKGQTIETIETWLLTEAAAETDLIGMIEQFVWRVVSAGLPLARFTAHAATLHPQLIGFGWAWSIDERKVEEFKVGAETRDSPSFLKNPLYEVMDLGREVRVRPSEAIDRWPIMRDLVERGFTDYLCFPFGGTPARRNAMSLSAKNPEGFSAADEAALRRLLRVLSLHIERQIQLRIATSVLDTYLGASVRQRVLDGAIQRRAGERLPAIVWMMDLRGFTAMSSRLSPEHLLDVLDAAFDAAACAVSSYGGEVLKFMGDGVLAVFPIDPADEGRAASSAAYHAALTAQAGLTALNAEPPGHLAKVEGWAPLRAGVALHAGDVFFGNIGAPHRLDFTVIGPAVNAVSRVEGLCKTLGEPVLLTEPVAEMLQADDLRPLGAHPLRGVAAPVGVFAPRRETVAGVVGGWG